MRDELCQQGFRMRDKMRGRNGGSYNITDIQMCVCVCLRYLCVGGFVFCLAASVCVWKRLKVIIHSFNKYLLSSAINHKLCYMLAIQH